MNINTQQKIARNKHPLISPTPKHILFIKTELGKEKYCKGCDDYFPSTKQFFYGTGYNSKVTGEPLLETLCKACYKEKYKPNYVRCYNVAHRYEVAA